MATVSKPPSGPDPAEARKRRDTYCRDVVDIAERLRSKTDKACKTLSQISLGMAGLTLSKQQKPKDEGASSGNSAPSKTDKVSPAGALRKYIEQEARTANTQLKVLKPPPGVDAKELGKALGPLSRIVESMGIPLKNHFTLKPSFKRGVYSIDLVKRF